MDLKNIEVVSFFPLIGAFLGIPVLLNFVVANKGFRKKAQILWMESGPQIHKKERRFSL